MMKKNVYIAHPISGDVDGNIAKIESILEHIRRDLPDIIPHAPYLESLGYLDDSKPEQRALGIFINKHFLRSGVIDEVWLYGDRLSDGMYEEIKVAHEERILVRFCSPEVSRDVSQRRGHIPDTFNCLSEKDNAFKYGRCRKQCVGCFINSLTK